MGGGAIVICYVMLAIIGPYIVPYDPLQQNYSELLVAPSRAHWMGTDTYGRDVLSRVVYGTRYALLVGVAAVTIQTLVGVTLGLIAGYCGGIVDTIIMRFTDMMLAIPTLVLALVIAGLLGAGLRNVIIAIGMVGWREYTRLIRGEVLSLKQESYIEAARAIGVPGVRIVLHHILPNVISTLAVYVTLCIPSAIIWAAALSYLGLGAQPPTPEWGAMLADGRQILRQAWWVGTFPGLGIMLMVLGFNFFGDGLTYALNPKLTDSGL